MLRLVRYARIDDERLFCDHPAVFAREEQEDGHVAQLGHRSQGAADFDTGPVRERVAEEHKVRENPAREGDAFGTAGGEEKIKAGAAEKGFEDLPVAGVALDDHELGRIMHGWWGG